VTIVERLTAALADRYRIERELGQGGMATVYLAQDLKHHRRVALKVLRPELSAAIGADRFLREIELTAGLQHPHILPLFDSGEADGLLFYVMPFVDGESLRDRLERERSLPLAEALRIASDVAAALTWAHSRGVVHRDIKPENILLAGGEALVADFGIALALTERDGMRLTGTGLSLGTPAYMSPEQIAGNKEIDGRSDVYALGCVLFEMITGEPPFIGPSPQSIITQALVDIPRHVRSLRGDVPLEVDVALMRALAKEPADRFATPRDFVDGCAPPAIRPVRRSRLVVVGAIALVALTVLIWPLWQSARTARARAELPVIEDLAARGQYLEAYDRATRAERRLGSDSVLARLLQTVSVLLTVRSEPAGAQVYLQRIPEEGEEVADSTPIGTTPITEQRLARADYRLSVHTEGYAPAERIASTTGSRLELPGNTGRSVKLSLPLRRSDSILQGMVAIPGGRYTIVSPDLPTGLTTELRPYLLDRFEVSNEEYRQFVRSGGYAKAGFGGGTAARLVDRTGLAAPRDWMSQEPPADRGNHPVTGVSWHEASAFCAAQGKRLPTLYEWEKAARDGMVSPVGIIMPWGYMSAEVTVKRRANFSGVGTMPVDAFPFGISPYGVHALAGNVKEWLQNPTPEGFAVAGGSWQDPAYVFSELGGLPGETATPAIGFRCARDAAAGAGDQGAGPVRVNPAPPVYRPVDAATFRSFLAFYRYDRQPAHPRISAVTETPDWRRERVWIDGVGGDSILAYLYLPKHATPPFQTLVQVPSGGAFFYEPVWTSTEADLGPLVKAGRAVLAPVFHGMIERPLPPGARMPPSPSVGFRDLMVRYATELRMALDYLETRPEIDTSRLAYVGVSLGAGSRLPLAGVDDRFRALVLIGAGIDERLHPTLPEASNVNFAPYLRPPKLFLNGRQDEEHHWLTRALPLWNLLREPKKLVLLEGVGHHPPVEMRVPPINEFLDRILGPVATAPPK
jgi:formylglycine-generating enzyme required for sulfatase activity/tRNA A-37 threonylcarbamoyl transferase component Bud32